MKVLWKEEDGDEMKKNLWEKGMQEDEGALRLKKISGKKGRTEKVILVGVVDVSVDESWASWWIHDSNSNSLDSRGYLLFLKHAYQPLPYCTMSVQTYEGLHCTEVIPYSFTTAFYFQERC